MNAAGLGASALFGVSLLLLPACGGPDHEAAHNIPEANAEDPMSADADHQGRNVSPVPDYHQIQFPEGYDSIVATMQYSRLDFPDGQYLSFSLMREDEVTPGAGWGLAFSGDNPESERLTVEYTFPDTAGGRYYLGMFSGSCLDQEIVYGIEVDYTIRWQAY